MAMNWRKLDAHKGVQVAHATACPARADDSKRCRKDTGICTPRYRKRLYPGWSPSTAVLSEALAATASTPPAERAGTSRTLEDVGVEWWWLFEGGRVPKRRGSGRPTRATLNGYRPLLFKLGRNATVPTTAPLDPDVRGLIFAEFGHRPGDEITEVELQRWVDNLRREDGELLSRSRITEILAVLRGIYSYALRSTRAIWKCPDPTGNLQIPPTDKERERRLRVAQVPEAKELLAALPDDIALPFAIAFGTGLRRSEIGRLEWPDVMWKAYKIHVRDSKSEAGEGRLTDISRLGMLHLKAEFARQGFPVEGRVVERSVISGKLGEAADTAWAAANKKRAKQRKPALVRITLQECRHTYASMLMAARYTVVEIMVNMGHTDLAATRRYLKKLPQPNQVSEADRLHNYEDGFADEAQAV